MLDKAKEQMDEEIDEVKQMNQFLIQSQVYNVREKQVLEQVELENDYLREEDRLNTMMDIERLKSIIYQEEKESKRKVTQKQQAQVIIEQIKDRELQRINEQELLDREKQLMQKQAMMIEDEEKRKKQEKIDQQKIIMAQVEDSNRQAI